MKVIKNEKVPYIELKVGAEKIYSVKKHSHMDISVGFIESGGSTVTCRELEFLLKPDSLILIPPSCVHLCYPEDTKRFRFRMLYINTDWFMDNFNINASGMLPASISLASDSLPYVQNFFYSFNDNDDLLEMESNTIYFLEYLFFELFAVKVKTDPGEFNNFRALKVKSHIDENYMDLLTLDDLAKIAGETKYSMLRRFKKKYKLTPHAYLVNLRINHARDLLKQKKSIADIAVLCGFFDQSHFIKTFRQYFGMNPNEYRG